MMLVWSQKLCAWVPWMGSRRAWRALPHVAAIAGGCVASAPTATLPLAPHDTGLPAHHASASPLRASSRLVWLGPLPYVPVMGLAAMAYPSAPLPPTTPLPSLGTAPPVTPMPPYSPAPVPVPEPSSGLIFATALIGFFVVRKLT